MRWSVYSTIKSHKALIKSWTMKLIGSVILDAAREGATQLAPVSREKKDANENMKVKRAKKVTRVLWPVVPRAYLSTALTQNTSDRHRRVHASTYFRRVDLIESLSCS